MAIFISDEDEQCEAHEGPSRPDRCPNRATVTVEEPYTSARFEQHLCDDCAIGQIDGGYRPTWKVDEADAAACRLLYGLYLGAPTAFAALVLNNARKHLMLRS